MKLDYVLLGKIAICASVSGVVAYYAQPLIHNNKDAADVLINVFSILAGFLVAVMTIMGEPVFHRQRTWRYNRQAKKNYEKTLYRHKDLFHAYLVTLAIIFVSRLVDGDKYPDVQLWLERAFLFLSCFAFIFSMALPDKLINRQLQRYDDQVDEKKDTHS